MKNRNMLVAFAACAAVILCALGASAASVNRSAAVYAARRWATSGAVLEKSLGQKVVSSETLTATNDVTLHVVRFDGGTAFVSSDTELEPIVAFTTSTNFSADAGNRLWALLKRDTIVRHKALAQSSAANVTLSKLATATAATPATTASATTSAASSAAESKWAKLLEGRSTGPSPLLSATVPNKLDGVSDVRVAPLVKSQWSQSTARGYNCYNYYTPYNTYCGCTATAMSQIMRYHEYPKEAVAAQSYWCTVNGASTQLTMQGGTYDWSKMTLCPASSSYVEENWAAIGKLTSDVGISIESDYTMVGTGSMVSRVAEALKNAFGYANGACIFNWAIANEAAYGDGRVHSNVGLHNLSVREKVIYANLDAKCPVELGVYGYGDEQIGDSDYWEGHAIVGDGYGYSEYGGEQVPYVHINLGWHGLDDAWYNIPEIHSPNSGSYAGSSGTAFTVLSSAAYNLFPTNTGNIVAGRVCDGDAEPIAGATMTIRAAGSSAVIATRTTDAKGIYAFIVPGGADYDITCDDPASGLTDTHTVNVPSTTMECNDDYGVYTEKDANVGNYWGNDADFEMSIACVRIVGGSLYLSLDKALAAAQDGDTLEILLPTVLKKSMTLNVNCTIVSTNDDPTATLVTRVDGALITVEDGKALTLSNVVFAVDAVQPTIDVEAGATLKIAGTLGLGTVRTADESGVDLCGTLALADGYDVSVDSPNSAKDGVFGTFSCDYTIASEKAKLISNARDLDLGGVADSSTGKLKWDVVTVPVGSAKVTVDIGAGAVGYRTFAAALKAVEGYDAQITIRQNVSHTNTVALANDLTLAAINGAVLSFGAEAGFVIPDDTHLTLTDITVSGAGVSIKDCAFKVTGGELTLGSGAVLSALSDDGVAKTYGADYGGAVVVTAGRFTMLSGSKIQNCTSHYQGGAVWLNGAGATADLLGGTITGCHAGNDVGGGAVYVAWLGANVNVAGDFTAKNNTMGSKSVAGNLYLSSTRTLFTLTNALTGTVGVRQSKSSLNKEGANFIAQASGLSESAARTSAAHFVNDINSDLIGTYDSAAQAIVWGQKPSDDGQCLEGDAGVRVKVEGESGSRFYTCIDDAFEYVKTNATFEVKGFVSGDTGNLDCLTKDVTIDHDVRITSWEGYSYNGSDIMILWRKYHAMYKVAKGGSLTLSNVKIVGACSWDDGEEDPWDDDPSCPFTPLFYDEDDDGNPIAVEDPSIGYGLISVDGGSLTLEDGARVGFVFGNASRVSNAITVFNGGTVTMKSGSRVMEVNNEYQDDYENSCGGGILLDHATGYFEGGLIYRCKAYRAGGLYVANGSTAYVSGDISIGWNSAHKYDGEDNTDDNVIVSKNSKLVLAGPLSCVGPDDDYGYIGVNEGIAGDTSCFATVDWEWTDFEELEESAEYFCHDRRGGGYVYGVPVTNWIAKTQHWDTRLVWSDSLSQANGITIDGQAYRGAIPAGLTVATPTAFSVTPTTGANGKQVLNLDGGVEGCWYTVYSTTDLSLPFTKEASVQLKAGETFEYEVDQTQTSKFYKVVAEEGLK